MTNNLKIWALALVVTLAACSKDSESDNDQNDQAIEELENTPLQANEVANNVVIQGGTKNDGTPPTPNEAISLDVSASSKTALLGEGFEVSIDSDAAITGAYLQFKANDGTMADSYYDIDINANSSSAKSLKRFMGKNGKNVSLITAKEDDDTLDVDFNSNIEPGTFCYVICVYDADGNISAPQEVCVTVESWGGNGNLVAEWNLTKEEYPGEEGGIDIDLAGVSECDTNTATCSNEMTLEFEECYLVEFGSITFKEDGTYEYEYKGGEDYLDYNTSIESCEASYIEYVYHYTSFGNWAYVADEKRLTIVEYSYNDAGTDGEGEQTYQPGDGELLYDGFIELDGNSLIITESFDDDGDGIFEEVFKAYFEKK
ncbi:hypothetical protein [Allomuricauda sp. R78024]|uniref:hypothetical protein n=1 Tax=Allomuricauda sp. R78024 TaxID=3093867 RepID=UPI0037C7B1E4